MATKLSEVLKAYDKPIVAIVRFDDPSPMPREALHVFYQVTIDPGVTSPEGAFIRFGKVPGDEIYGWKPVDLINVYEILGYASWENNELKVSDIESENKRMVS